MYNKYIFGILILSSLFFFPSCAEDDTEPPVVYFTDLADNDIISGSYNINVTVEDNSGVDRVELFYRTYNNTTENYDTTSCGEMSSSSGSSDGRTHYMSFWVRTEMPNGVYDWWANAYDDAGNMGRTDGFLTLNLENSVTVNLVNQLEQDILYDTPFDSDGSYGTLEAGASVSFQAPMNYGTFNLTAYNNEYCGESLNLNTDIIVGGEDIEHFIHVDENYFYLYLTNNLSADVLVTYVNLPSAGGDGDHQEQCWTTTPNNGVKMGQGYYHVGVSAPTNIVLKIDDNGNGYVDDGEQVLGWDDISSDLSGGNNQIVEKTASGFLSTFQTDGTLINKIKPFNK